MMFAFGKDAFGRNAGTANAVMADVTLAELAAGLLAGTKVATQMGWRAVEAVTAGDQVLTFDGGLQTVVSVSRQVVWTGGAQADASEWPLFVPAGALGNRDDMELLAQQPVLVESDAAEVAFGDPFAMIPAAALDGFRGIMRVAPAERLEVISLTFAQDEVVFANIGALFFCPKSHDMLDAGLSPYQILPMDQADALVEALAFENFGGADQRHAKDAAALFQFAA